MQLLRKSVRQAFQPYDSKKSSRFESEFLPIVRNAAIFREKVEFCCGDIIRASSPRNVIFNYV